MFQVCASVLLIRRDEEVMRLRGEFFQDSDSEFEKPTATATSDTAVNETVHSDPENSDSSVEHSDSGADSSSADHQIPIPIQNQSQTEARKVRPWSAGERTRVPAADFLRFQQEFQPENILNLNQSLNSGAGGLEGGGSRALGKADGQGMVELMVTGVFANPSQMFQKCKTEIVKQNNVLLVMKRCCRRHRGCVLRIGRRLSSESFAGFVLSGMRIGNSDCYQFRLMSK